MKGLMIIFAILIVILLLILLGLLESKRESRSFQITEYKIISPKLKGMKSPMKILFLSDLHNCSYGEENQDLLSAIKNSRADLILIGGDMLVRRNGTSYEQTLKFLKQLPGIAPVYCANGNHEQKLKLEPECFEQSYEDYKNELISSGIHMLENESIVLDFNGKKAIITGLEIPLKGYKKFFHCKLEPKNLLDCIGEASSDYQILLAHHPGHMSLYKNWGADLVLSGHFHGGVLRLPGIGGVIAPDFRLFPRYSGGIYKEGNQTFVVSRGLGVHSVPFRIFNPPELVVLTLQGSFIK